MAAKTLDAFISMIKTENVARLNRFKVLLSNPASNGSDELVCMYCEQASLPSITYASQPTRTFGDQREVVYERTFESLSLTFLIDRQFKVKEYFDQWGDKVIDPKTRLCGFYDNYIKDIEIIAQDVADNNVYSTKIYEAYPKTIAAVNLDNSSKEVAQLQVTFNYKYHINNRGYSSLGSMYDAPTKTFPLGQEGVDLLYESLSSDEFTRVPDMYFDNFTGFQQSINDRLAISNIERQGQIAGIGISSLYSKLRGMI